MRVVHFAVAVSLLFPAAAQASEFWYVAEGQTYSFWADLATLKTEKQLRTLTVYQIFAHVQNQGVQIAMAPAEFDCAGKTVTFQSGIALGANLYPVSPLEERPPIAPSAKSVLETVESFVCGNAEARKKIGNKFGDDKTLLKDVVIAYLKTFSK